ncbi:MAG: nucleotidyltransferase domain-containing protein, partial [Blastocatellia bacterium]
AYGEPTPESDLDLLVVMPYEGSYFLQAMAIRRRLGLVTPMDLLVRTQEELQYRLDIGDRFMREIVERGKVMHEATHV